MKNYLISMYALVVSLSFVGYNCNIVNNNAIVDVNLIVSPKEAKGNNSIWSVLSRIDSSTSMITIAPVKQTTLSKENNFVDFFFKPALFFKRNNFTNLLKSTLTYSNANSLSNYIILY
jgi:hypothetical protein